MSARRGSKPVVKERRLSIMGSHGTHRLRKKRDGTPEKSATPSQEPDENLTPSRNVIWNEEIEKLQIRPEDLQKIHVPRPPSAERLVPLTKVSVKKLKPASERDKPKSRMVSVAKPAPPDAPLKPMDYTGYAGPRYNPDGHVITHSLLGTYEDFHREATRRGDLMDMPSPRGDEDRAQTPSLKYERKRPRRERMRTQVDENNALRNWQLRMLERKKQQGYISKLLQKAPEDLAMNQADNYRSVQEARYLIDRTIPAVDYGKGYRVGSEFWHQKEQFGDDITGIHMTLTQTQQGYPCPVEHVGLSQLVKEEKGCEWMTNQSAPNYPWHKSEYLKERKDQLQPFIEELDPHKPDFDGLQVVGSNRPFFRVQGEEKEPGEDEDDIAMDVELEAMTPNEREMEAEINEENDPLAPYPDVHPAPVFGPSLLFAGQPARWTGDSFSMKDQVGIEARVTFDAFTGDRVTSHLEIVNDGTTSIYFTWKKMAKDNPFELVHPPTQRFYFNNSSGVILPGDTLKFPFVFKSPNAGVFTEQWRLETRPVVCGGATLLVTLRGVAIQEDKFKQQRQELERELLTRQAQQVVGHLLRELVNGIRTPERSRSPVDAYITEEEIFRRNNPGLEYRHDLVSELKAIHSQLAPEEEQEHAVWSLSVQDLQDVIMELDEDDERKESLLHQMNATVARLSYICPKPLQEQLYTTGYQIFADAIDRMVGESMMLRNSLGLPEKELEDGEGEPNIPTKPPQKLGRRPSRLPDGTSQRGVKPADRSKTDAKKDSKPAVKDAKAPKGKETPKPDPKGAKAPSATAKKTPTPVKPTPTPGVAQGDREPGSGTHSQVASPDTTLGTSDSENATAERIYKENFSTQVYEILGSMVEQMDHLFTGIKDIHSSSQGISYT